MVQQSHTHAGHAALDAGCSDEVHNADSAAGGPEFAPTQNVTQAIADHLARRIVTGDLPPGGRIYELKVARELNVSRGSVREALLLLERRLLIEIVPRRGAMVTSLAVADVDDLLDTLGVNERHWLSLAFRDVANRRGDGRGEALARSVDAMVAGAKTESLAEVLVGHEAFYRALGGDEGRFSAATFACLLPTTQRILNLYVTEGFIELRDISRYYQALLNAIVESDEARLEELFAAYQRRMRQVARRAFG